MNEIIKIKNNSFFSFVSIASRLIPNVLIFWMLARFFGPETFGKFSYSHTLANTFLLFADFGFDLLLTTEIAQNRSAAKQIFQQYFWIKIFLALASLLVMIAFVLIRGGDFDSILLGILFAFYMLFNTIANFFVASFKGFERLDYDAKVSLLMNLFLLLSSVVVFLTHQSVYLIAASYVTSRIMGFIYSLKLVRNTLPNLSYKILFYNVTENLRKAFIFGTLMLANGFLFQIDTVMLGILKSDYEVGIYQSVKNLMLVPLIVPMVLYSSMLPTLARNFKENYDNWTYLNGIFFKMIFWLNIPISMVIYIFPEQIIELAYGTKNYLSAIPILKLFSIILFIRSTSDYIGLMLITSSRQKIHIYISLVGIFLSIFCSIAIVPFSGAFGSGIVYLIIITFVLIAYLLANYKIFIGQILNSRYLILSLATVFTAVILLKLNNSVSIFFGIPLIFIIFIGFAFSFFFTKSEKKKLLSLSYLLEFRNN